MITLTNAFHGTETRIRANVGDTITRRRMLDIWRRLCGVEGCTCSGDGGVRGGDYRIEQADDYGQKFVIVENR